MVPANFIYFASFCFYALPVQGYIGIGANDVYLSADSCVQSCARSISEDYQIFTFGCDSNVPKCLCDVPSLYSSTMDYALSMCVVTAPCHNPAATSIVTAIFSAYCSVNHVGAIFDQAGTPAPSSPATTTDTGASSDPTATSRPTPASPSYPTQTSASTSDSDASSASQGGLAGLSRSDKVAIMCAIGGAIVSFAIAIPGWIFLKQKRARKAREAAAAATATAKENDGSGRRFPDVQNNNSNNNNNNNNNNNSQPHSTPLQIYNQMHNHSHSHIYSPGSSSVNASTAHFPSSMNPPPYTQQQSWQWQQGGKQA